jgi:circadian clock protein KaiC
MTRKGRSRPPDEAGGTELMARDPTGVPGLDQVLGGGLFRGSLTVVSGPPGSGKTILANHLAFGAARAGRRALIFTALSESPSKTLQHLRSFSFFEPEQVGNAIKYLSLEGPLDGGLGAAAQSLTNTARQEQATLVVLDGLSGLRGAAESLQATRQFLYTLGGQLNLLGITCLVTNEAQPRDPAQFPEGTTADVILGLYFELSGVRQHRRLEVIKVRGAAPLPGLHSLQLSDAGVSVYPLLEARVNADTGGAQTDGLGRGDVPDGPDTHPATAASAGVLAEAAVDQPRATFGLPELDGLLGGGLTRGTSTVLVGNQGTGKTLLGLYFALSGVQAGEPAVYLGFRESRHQLLSRGDAFTLGAPWRAALAPGGGVTLLRWNPVQVVADILADQLLTTLDRTGARRLVVDSILEWERAVAECSAASRVDGYMAALVTALRQRGVSTLFLRETSTLFGAAPAFPTDQLAVLADNVVLAQWVPYRAELHRLLSVVKMRFSPHDLGVREFTIAAPDGIRVLRPAESGSGVLSAFAPGNAPMTSPLAAEDQE